MSDLYADLRATAAELITEFGQAAVIRRMPAGTYDPVTGQTVDGDGHPVVAVDYACSVLGQDVNSMAVYAQSLVQGSLISEADCFFLMSSAEPPKAADLLVIGSQSLTIQGVRPLAPGGIAVYYSIRARG